jgi:hypothetical protein
MSKILAGRLLTLTCDSRLPDSASRPTKRSQSSFISSGIHRPVLELPDDVCIGIKTRCRLCARVVGRYRHRAARVQPLCNLWRFWIWYSTSFQVCRWDSTAAFARLDLLLTGGVGGTFWTRGITVMIGDRLRERSPDSHQSPFEGTRSRRRSIAQEILVIGYGIAGTLGAAIGHGAGPYTGRRRGS